ncbi:uncharacterized protein ARMOST_02062 [Armillaria ostoyae]|uniref:Uncharacterized protein n=1 Tax=Armillaria ostoyae TaxID=47428 RepID=A0A284QQS6_ARMOS|nr:uncharacterized protein ARMOST_02062 [Armillaria ostoyae]
MATLLDLGVFGGFFDRRYGQVMASIYVIPEGLSLPITLCLQLVTGSIFRPITTHIYVDPPDY